MLIALSVSAPPSVRRPACVLRPIAGARLRFVRLSRSPLLSRPVPRVRPSASVVVTVNNSAAAVGGGFRALWSGHAVVTHLASVLPCCDGGGSREIPRLGCVRSGLPRNLIQSQRLAQAGCSTRVSTSSSGRTRTVGRSRSPRLFLH